MKHLFSIFFLFGCILIKAQLHDSIINSSESMLKKLKLGDSIIYYQCHVEEAGIQMTTASGQTLTGNPQKRSITEKFLIVKGNDHFKLRYFVSSYTDLPNRKFSGLKIREKPYWNFRLNREFILSEADARILIGLEKKGRDAIEYDFVISKNNTNQLIIKFKKDFKQLVLENPYVFSKTFIH